ncbi:MAG: hypothetical protein QOK29_1653 [Rhodospirillaceae bacterium]|jgi:hypothetical protein|nr:hypothetical protein [Rhodospirillaceae bacterium]
MSRSIKRVLAALAGGVAVSAVIALAPASLGLSAAAWAQEKPVAPEKNPPGDIPDSQVFVSYVSPAGFALEVPEGWARAERADGVGFADKYDSVDVSISPAASAPTPETVRETEAASLLKNGRAVKITAITRVKLPAGSAVLIAYTSNSEPNTVTNRQIRLENNRFLFHRAGREAALTLSAPAGADNADQWQLMAKSFHWN